MEKQDMTSQSSVLSRWGILGKKLKSDTELTEFKCGKGLLKATEKYASDKMAQLKLLLDKTENRIAPLKDPLKMNFPLNRWLTNDREEGYSDWLAWILGELNSPKLVGYILYGDKELISGNCELGFTVEREVWVPAGHSNQTGRLDVVLYCGVNPVIVIEIKVTSVNGADTAKQEGYFNWIQQQNPNSKALLLATDGDKNKNYYGFELLLWSDLCIRLRQQLPSLIRDNNYTLAALIAGFIGAVEQNLLGLPSLRWIENESNPRCLLPIIDSVDSAISYLKQTLN